VNRSFGASARAQHVVGVGLVELRGDLQRRKVLADRPRVDVEAAGRPLRVPALSGPGCEQRGLAPEQLAQALGQPECGGEEDVRRGAAVDEVARQLVAPGAALPLEHPLRRCGAVVDVARVGVGAALEQQVHDLARAGEVQRRLSIAAALVDALGVVIEHAPEQIRPVEVRRGTSVRLGARRDQPVGDIATRRVQRVEPTRPPVALPVRVSAELEEHVDHGGVVRERDDRRRIEREQRRIDQRPGGRVSLEQRANRRRVSCAERALELLDHRIGGRERLGSNMVTSFVSVAGDQGHRAHLAIAAPRRLGHRDRHDKLPDADPDRRFRVAGRPRLRPRRLPRRMRRRWVLGAVPHVALTPGASATGSHTTIVVQ